MTSCGDIGAVPRADVLRTLCKAGVRIDHDGDEFSLSKDHVLEVQLLPDSVPRKMVHRLSNRFGLQIHDFYHPNDPLQVN